MRYATGYFFALSKLLGRKTIEWTSLVIFGLLAGVQMSETCLALKPNLAPEEVLECVQDGLWALGLGQWLKIAYEELSTSEVRVVNTRASLRALTSLT